MTLFVLDASVAAKWFLPPRHEPLANEALELYEKFVRAELEFAVPDLFWAEVGSVFWKSVRLGRFPAVSAERSMAALLDCGFRSHPSESLLAEAFRIATRFDRSVYDSLYVALAVGLGAPLITADERLANALATRFPIKWLGGSWM